MTAWAVFTALCAGGVLLGEWRGARAAVWTFKPLASIGFLGAAAAAVSVWSGYSIAVFAALALCLAGDVLLIPADPRAFIGGLASFLVGHVAYGAAFVIRGVDPASSGLALLALVPVLAVVMRWLLPHVKGRMRVPVLAYMAVITAMVALSAGTHAKAPALVLPVAAAAFFASDIAVARNRFVSPGIVNRLWGLPLYYAANLAFASSLA